MSTGRGLGRLDILLGEWSITSKKYPEGKGRLTAEWIEGGAYLRLEAGLEDPRFPATVQIIGADDAGEEYTSLYYDSRDVRRLYQMTIADGQWRSWRFAPGFSQRYIGHISADGKTISGNWEFSEDGKSWRVDFDLTYTRID